MQVDPLKIITQLAAMYSIPARRVTPPFDGLENFDYGLRKALDPAFDWQEFGRVLLEQTPENTLLLAEGTFELRFALFRVPDEADTVFLIGPWTSGPRSEKAREWARKHIGEAGDLAVQEYYNGVRVLENDNFVTALYSILLVTWADKKLEIATMKEFLPFVFQPNPGSFTEPEFKRDIPVSMIEQRYEWEEQLMEAVSLGDELQAIELMKLGARFTLTDRFSGTLYREKTKLIILNTSFRKAIAHSNVHPYYIDQISAAYARRIEELSDISEDEAFVNQMIRDYCAYVRRYSLKGCSPAVQKVINHINLNVAEAHTLKSLSALCHISPTYLSTLFRQETGSTLIDYINTQRVRRAAHLLESTDRTVAGIAEEMGILDVNYFARIFKRTLGVTPTRYRREKRNQQNS